MTTEGGRCKRTNKQEFKKEFKKERKKTIDIESSCPKKIIFEVKGYPLQRIIAVGPTIVDRWETSEACSGPTYHFEGDYLLGLGLLIWFSYSYN